MQYQNFNFVLKVALINLGTGEREIKGYYRTNKIIENPVISREIGPLSPIQKMCFIGLQS